MTAKTSNSKLDPGFWIGLILVVGLMYFFPVKCTATTKCDTIPCNPECVTKIVQCPTVKGDKTRFYVAYVDEKQNILDLIPISNSTYEYIQLCKKNQIVPSLGIKVRNGEIVSIVRYKRKIRRN